MFACVFNSAIIRITLMLFALLGLTACGGGSSGKHNSNHVQLDKSNEISPTSTSSASSISSLTVNSLAISSSSNSGNALSSSNSSNNFASPSSSLGSVFSTFDLSPSNISSAQPILLGGIIQAKDLNLTVTTVTTFSGSTSKADGIGEKARFFYPQGITSNGTFLYVADTYNHTIRKIDTTTNEVSTIAGKALTPLTNPAPVPVGDGTFIPAGDGVGEDAKFNYPESLTTDGTNLFVADTGDSTIRQIVIATGEVITLAGSAKMNDSVDDVGIKARFRLPKGITTDGVNLYVADADSIRKVVIATGVTTTLVRIPKSNLEGIIINGGNLFVTNSSNYNNYTICKIVIATGEVTTIAGAIDTHGSVDGTGAEARFFFPIGITTDGTNLYVTDTSNNTIRKIVIATGVVTTIAGSADIAGTSNGIGANANFKSPQGITTDGTNLFVSDTNNFTIRKIVIATNAVTTIAGSAGAGDGTGAAARFYHPKDITSDGQNLYVADTDNNTIRKIVITTGEVKTIAGTPGIKGNSDGLGMAASFSLPEGITNDGHNLYVADTENSTIRKINIDTGEVTTLAGKAGTNGSADGAGTLARFSSPAGITTDGTNLFVSDTNNFTIRKIVIATGEVTTFAGSAGASGSTDGTGAIARFSYSEGITTDGTNLYVADSSNYTVRKVAIATGVVTTIAGSASNYGSTDGIGTAAKFSYLSGITTDGTNLYVTDYNNRTVRKIVIATGLVTTLAGKAGTGGNVDGTGDIARFYYPAGITTDGTSLYLTDTNNQTIRKIE